MKLMTLILTGAVVACASTAWAQNESTTTPTAHETQVGSNDAIVKMRQEEAAANRVYEKKVAAAKKTYDHKKAEAKKERDAAIAAARYGSGTNQ
ncbi:hypothetical protein [Paraburkholderia diazotrophica]|uniref:Uncharacterized protein n=1 Tax=Paraburkholderia diazotrophica TaxID=667676 RepID=A0A1H7EKH8_9BURK|nr:hypothetical protein [Paraburkholderia diazotrophica]SEK14399.1 hypothetical protein SAMN05192539_11023 [Paraburkholderia diazotrophica]